MAACSTSQPSPGLSPTDHLCWLLQLSPRMRSALPRVCSGDAVEAALARMRRGAASPFEVRRTPKAAAAAAAKAGSRSSGGAIATAGATGQAQKKAAAQGLAVGPVPPVPSELVAAWRALQSAAGFCRRCARLARPGPAGSGAAAAANPASPAGVVQGLSPRDAAAATGLSPMRPSTPPGAGGPGAAQQQGQAQVSLAERVHSWWFLLLEVYVSGRRAAVHALCAAPAEVSLETAAAGTAGSSSQDAPACDDAAHDQALPCETQPTAGMATTSAPAPSPELVLSHLWGALLEEAIACAADCVPLGALVRYLGERHGHAAVRELRGALTGLLRCVTPGPFVCACMLA